MFYQAYPAPEKQILDYYRTGKFYRSSAYEPNNDKAPNNKELYARLNLTLDFLKRSKISPKRHLDFGSSYGEFLDLTKQTFGCETQGVEVGEACRKIARHPTAESLGEVQGVFDLVSCLHVLEHTADPLAMLQSFRPYIEEWLLIEVPDAIFTGTTFKSQHILGFTPGSLAKMLCKAGYAIWHISAHGDYAIRTQIAMLVKPL